MVAGGDEEAVSVRAMAVEEELIITASKEKQTKTVSNAKRVKTPLNHPPYRQMIAEALCELKERDGSSQKAIAKFIEEKYKADLQPNFKKLLLTQLKNLTKSGELVRAKNSFKLKTDAKPAKKAEKKKMKSATSDAAKVGKAKQKKQPAKSIRKISTPRRTPRSIKTAKPSSQKN